MKTSRAPRRILFTVDWLAEALFLGFARYAREAHWLVYFGAPYLQASASLQPDGAVLYLRKGDDALLRWARRQPFPILDLGMSQPAWARPKLILDNEAIGRTGARHLLDRGYRRLAFALLEQRWPFDARGAAFAATARAAGASIDLLPALGLTPLTTRNARLRLRTLAGSARAPLGIMAANDAAAAVLLALCRAEGLRVPEQVAVLGVDNHPVHTALAEVPLSSVDPAFDTWGYEAARLLDRMMSGRTCARAPRLIPPRGVVTRRSTDQIAIEHPGIARALRFVMDHYRERIHVADVATAAAMSRRRVQDAFARHVGHPIHEELVRQRMAEARRLLQATGRTVAEIAGACGFGSPERMAKVFRQRMRTTPRAFRKSGTSPALGL